MKKKVVVVGAGPGGIAAAVTAAENDAEVFIIDENPGLGGQIWRQQLGKVKDKNAQKWISRLEKQKVKFESSTTVLGIEDKSVLCLHPEKGKFSIGFDNLILACGAKELFLPFPGWTLPNVLGCGGAQAMVKSGLDVKGKRVVISGSGPLLLAVASYLKSKGAKVLGIYEQTESSKLYKLTCFLLSKFPKKIIQGIGYRLGLLSSPWKKGWWVKQANGNESLESITVTNGKQEKVIDCDILACGFGLKANLELAKVLNCEVKSGFISVDQFQETSVKNIYAVGELTGIGGLDKALLEGENAANVIVGNRGQLRPRKNVDRFVDELSRAFELRREVKVLSKPDTIFCRCEDVEYKDVSDSSNQRATKLYSRCGMGACQGRVCSSIGQELFGWELNKIQSPIVPVNVESLID